MFYSKASHLAVLAAAPLLLTLPAFAQTATTAPDAPPARNADVWNGRKHAVGAGVEGQERAAGVDTQDQQRRQTDEVEQLQQQILQRAQQGTNDGVMSGKPGTQPMP